MKDADNPEPEALTVDELAARTGMTVRNIREWQTLGLLPKPGLRGRVGYYPPAAAERIERIKKLHAEGFTLELIRRMLEAGGKAGDDVMRLADVLRSPFREGEVSLVDVEAALRELGLDPADVAATTAEIRRRLEEVAELFERVWLEHVWDPFIAAGMPADQLQRIQETATRVPGLARDAVIALFTEAMGQQIERGIARELGRVSPPRS